MARGAELTKSVDGRLTTTMRARAMLPRLQRFLRQDPDGPIPTEASMRSGESVHEIKG